MFVLALNRIQVDLDDDLLEWVNEQSKKKKLSRSSLIRTILAEIKDENESEIQKKDIGEK